MVESNETDESMDKVRIIRDGNMFQRVLDTILEGGKTGVEMGMAIIPGVLIVCTFVMMLTFKISLVPEFLKNGLIGPNDIAVFTAMGMCWSGYLSTHIGMMDALGVRKLSSKAIVSHTIGGIVAGIVAHYLFLLLG